MAFDVTLIVIDTLEWSEIPDLTYNVGQDVDEDLWEYLQEGFDGIVTRDVSADEFPDNLSIVNGQYLRGTVTEDGVFTLRLVATQNSETATSSDFDITVIDVLWTEEDADALWTDADGNPLWVE